MQQQEQRHGHREHHKAQLLDVHVVHMREHAQESQQQRRSREAQQDHPKRRLRRSVRGDAARHDRAQPQHASHDDVHGGKLRADGVGQHRVARQQQRHEQHEHVPQLQGTEVRHGRRPEHRHDSADGHHERGLDVAPDDGVLNEVDRRKTARQSRNRQAHRDVRHPHLALHAALPPPSRSPSNRAPAILTNGRGFSKGTAPGALRRPAGPSKRFHASRATVRFEAQAPRGTLPILGANPRESEASP